MQPSLQNVNMTIRASVAIVILLVASCSKDVESSLGPAGKQHSDNSLQSTLTTYDSIGLFHNQALAYVGAQCGFNSTTTHDEGAESIADWFIDLDTTDGLTVSSRSAMVLDVMNIIHEVDSLDALGRKGFLNKYPLSAAGEALLDSLLAIFDAIPSRSLAQTQSAFVNLQNQVVISTAITDEDEHALLTGLAVARYSVDIWWAELDVNSKTGAPLQAAKSKVGQVAEADAKGAVMGAIGGFVGGFAYGAALGWAIGGPVGALGTGANTAVRESLRAGLISGIIGSVNKALNW